MRTQTYWIHALTFLITISLIILQSANAEKEATSNYGTLHIEKEEYFIPKNGTRPVELYGNVIEYKENVPIIFTIKKPDGAKEDFSVTPKRTGEFSARIILQSNWNTGTYEVSATYNERELVKSHFL